MMGNTSKAHDTHCQKRGIFFRSFKTNDAFAFLVECIDYFHDFTKR